MKYPKASRVPFPKRHHAPAPCPPLGTVSLSEPPDSGGSLTYQRGLQLLSKEITLTE